MDERTIQTTKLPDNLSKVIVQTNLRTLSIQNSYLSAKKNGDNIAALDIVTKLVKDDKIQAMSELLNQNKPIYFVPVVNVEANNQLNQLPIQYADFLANAFNGNVFLDIVKTQGTPNTNELLSARIKKNIVFNGSIKDKNAQYVIVDDNYTSGKTILALMEHLKSEGADIKAVTTLGFSKYSYYLKPHEHSIEALKNKLSIPDSDIKLIIGHTFNYMTNSEIQALNMNSTISKYGHVGLISFYQDNNNIESNINQLSVIFGQYSKNIKYEKDKFFNTLVKELFSNIKSNINLVKTDDFLKDKLKALINVYDKNCTKTFDIGINF